MKDKIKVFFEKLPSFATAALVMVGLFLLIVGISGTVMRVFGFHYDSVGQLILYFLLVELLGFPVDLLCQGLPRLLYKRGVADGRQINLFYIPLDTLCSMAVFWIGDQIMEGISATMLSLWIIAFLFAVLTLPIQEGNPMGQ